MQVLGVDWGTTSLRAYLVDAKGAISEQVVSQDGLTKARQSGFAEVFAQNCAALLQRCDVVVMSGMIGAREGWREAKYCPCPVDCAKLAEAMVELDELTKPAWIAPGVVKEDESRPDVMRGEETQILGALETGGGDGVYVLPGTHTKWVQVAKGQIVDFTTFMTGDVYQALSTHSVLRLMISSDDPLDEDAFARGVKAGKQCAADGMLLAEMFGARTLGLFAKLAPNAMGSYLSGILLGNEITSARRCHPCTKVVLVGEPQLVKRYELGCKLLNLACELAPANVVVQGQLALAKALT